MSQRVNAVLMILVFAFLVSLFIPGLWRGWIERGRMWSIEFKRAQAEDEYGVFLSTSVACRYVDCYWCADLFWRLSDR